MAKWNLGSWFLQMLYPSGCVTMIHYPRLIVRFADPVTTSAGTNVAVGLTVIPKAVISCVMPADSLSLLRMCAILDCPTIYHT